MTINELYSEFINNLKLAHETGEATAITNIIFEHFVGISTAGLIVNAKSELQNEVLKSMQDALAALKKNVPVQYIIGKAWFYNLSFSVTDAVLIPRPETELIIDEVLADHKKKSTTGIVRVLDLGSGTGCIGLSILKNIPNSELVTIERSQTAFEVLTENIKSLELNDRVKAIHSDVLKVDVTPFSQFDYVVSNPPYIDQKDKETEQFVKKFEPHEALFSPDQGLSDIKSWAARYSHLVKPNSLMLFEIGYQQGSAVKVYFDSLQKFKSVDVIKDLSGLDRIIKARA